MSASRYQTLLRFSDRWLELGILTEEQLARLGEQYEEGPDRATEHYRWGAFQEYLHTHRPLTAEMAEALFELGAQDPDFGGAGSSMMHTILDLPECPETLLYQALFSGRKHLVRVAAVRLAAYLPEPEGGRPNAQ